MNADKTYTANFAKKQYPLTIIVVGEGTVSEEIITNGRVEDRVEDYDVGTLVKLTATPSEGGSLISVVVLITKLQKPLN